MKPYEVESYLRQKALQFRRRGQKAELKNCPFCSGGDDGRDKYTCVVYLDESGGNFKCMRGKCAQSGSFWQFVEHFGDDPRDFYKPENFNRPPAPEKQIVPELRPVLSYKSEKIEPQRLTPAALHYLNRRGFDLDVLDEMPVWCDEKGLINFGYYHEGELCMVKVRHPRKPEAGEPKAWQKWAGGLRTLYGLELCDFSKGYIVITFGEYDAIALRQARIENAVSVPCGDSDLEWINVCFDRLKELSEIYLWIDNDEAGKKALPRIAARLGVGKIKLVSTTYKDANEMLVFEAKKHGQTEAEQMLWQAVKNADWIYKGDVVEFAEIAEEQFTFEGYKTGISLLDTGLGGALKGRLTLHSGSNKAGKSTAINQITATVVAQGAVACVYAGEDEVSTYKYNLQVHIAGFEGGNIRTSKAGAEYIELVPEYKQRVNEWTRGRLYVISRRSGLNEDTILENFRLAFERFGCDFFVVDNLMKLVAAKDTNNLNFRQTQVVNKLSDFAKETGSHVNLIVHTNKEDTETAPPKSSREIAGAKEIVNLCDSAVNWWRVPESSKHEYANADAVCTILENRVFGIRGSVNLIFDWRVRRYAETNQQLMEAIYPI